MGTTRRALRPIRHATRFVAAGDNHGNEADPDACNALLEFCRWFKPTIRIHLGDGVNLDLLRSRATEDERAGGFTEDMASATEFNRLYEPTHYLAGNHCHRMARAMDSPRAWLSELATIMWNDLCNSLGKAAILPYCKRRGVLRLGDYSFIHGYSAGIYAVRKAALSYGNVIMGHLHRVDMQAVERLDGAVGYCAGCLCKLDLPYNAAQIGTLAQSHGFISGYLTQTNRLVVFQNRRFDGQWWFQSEMQTL